MESTPASANMAAAPGDEGQPSDDLAVPQTTAPTDPMMAKLSVLLRETFDRQGWSFSIQGKPMTSVDVAAPTGLLPILAFRASVVYEEAMGRTMPLYYFPNPDALCTVSPAAEEGPENTMIMWGHFLHYAVEDWVKRFPKLLNDNVPIPLDDLYDQWYDAANKSQLQFRDKITPRATPSRAR